MTEITTTTVPGQTPAHALVEKTFGLEYFTITPKVIEMNVKTSTRKKIKSGQGADTEGTSEVTPTAEPKQKLETKTETIPVFGQNNAKRLVLAVLREVIAPFINRSDDPEETITLNVNGRDLIEVPARKMKSKEKLAGMRLCRAYEVISGSYEYNAVKNSLDLSNPNSVLFGDANVVEGDSAMLPSRIKYSSTYSVRDRIKLVNKLTHNALSEQGTMWDRTKKKHRESLFSTEYVLPGTIFLSFLVIDDPTPESLIHILMCLKETRYGAQTSITGPNIRNTVVASFACRNEPPVTSYTIVKSHPELLESKNLKEDLVRTVIQELAIYNGQNGKLVSGKELSDLLMNVDKFDGNSMRLIYNKLKQDAVALCEYAGIGK